MQVEPTPVNRNRDVTINIRAHQAQRDLIDRAAETVGKSRSEDAKKFYEKCGFISSPVVPMTLLITVADAKAALGIVE
jgi:hypothetical protein